VESADQRYQQVLLGCVYAHSGDKFLLTSRPYLDIKVDLQELERKMPTIYLHRENEEEVGKISREINMVVRSKIAGMDRGKYGSVPG
jgi:hypothetical protein